MTPTRRVLLALLLPAALIACSGGSDDDSADADPAAAAADAETAGEEGGAGSSAGGDAVEDASSENAAGPDATPTAVQLGRDVVRTADISLTVEDVTEASAAAVRLAEQAGGFQAAGSIDLAGEHPVGEVVLRVPALAFSDVVAGIARLGEVADQRIGSDDVTGTVVDLEARVGAARTSVERVRGFLDRTGNVTELAAVERELLTREAELESLLGQLAAIRDQVDLSTVTARFGVEDPPPPVVAAADPQPSDDIPAPARALRQGWVVLLNVVKAAAAALAFALPLALLAVPAWIGWRLVTRRLRRLAD